MPKRWIEPEERAIPKDLQDAIGGHPLVSETLVRLGITRPEAARAFLDPKYYTPSPASDLPGINQAVARINQAIKNSETILVWGDFDVDGQTSTTLLIEALHELGANVVYHIPNRAIEGHGIKPEILEALLSKDPPHPHPYPPQPLGQYTPDSSPLSPSLLLTCDTGIAEHQAVDRAHALGLDVIITDHHELAETLPQAEIVINPHLLPEGHPLGTLPGVGVAYKLVEALFSENPAGAEAYLDLVALGIVADVAEQTGDTRYLLQRGLQVLQKIPRPGLAALYEFANIHPIYLNEGNIGFGIGPRLNALGRLSDANPIVEFFTTRDSERAKELAYELEKLNLERRGHTDRVTQSALGILKIQPNLLEYSALVLAQPSWPKGVIGIVASRMVEIYGKPTVLLNIGEDGVAQGSARSVEGLHLSEAIGAQADLLIGYGGHKGAAGLALREENIPEFRTRLSRTVKKKTAGLDYAPQVKIDFYIPLEEIGLSFVDEIDRLSPFGAGNPSLTLVSRGVRLVNKAKIGREKEHRRLVVEDQNGVTQEVLWWRSADEALPEDDEIFDLAFHASANTFRGERGIQLVWVDFRITGEYIPETLDEKSSVSVTDYRDQTHPLQLVKVIRENEGIQVWAEGIAKKPLEAIGRHELMPANAMVVWTVPPSRGVLMSVLEKVKPSSIYVFATNPDLDTPKKYLTRLTGLVKNVLNKKSGKTSLKDLTVGMAHTQQTVETGLKWLEAKGTIRAEVDQARVEGDQGVRVMRGNDIEREDLTELDRGLKILLEETKAYRKYFLTADPNSVFRFELD